MKIRNQTFDFENEAYIMGILNVTPDSFSDGGKFNQVDRALSRAEQMVQDGAHLIDVGGESTRPGHTPISAAEEMDRVLPVIKKIREHFDIPLSVDTYKAVTLEEALKAGADIANDIWGFKKDPEMAKVVARYGCPVVLMQNRNQPIYRDLISDMIADLEESIAIGERAGVHRDQVIIDPGLGFALEYEMQLEVINRLEAFAKMGCPLMLATSKKRFIGKATDRDKASDRIYGTVATSVVGLMKGARILRVHDIRPNLDALKMTMAILREGR